MASYFFFERTSSFELITISGFLLWNDIQMNAEFAIDTGATHSVLDANLLYARGWRPNKDSETTQVRTASGIVSGHIVNLVKLDILGEKSQNFPVFVYDFLSAGSAENYDGLLGLDLLQNLDTCLRIADKQIRVERI